MDDLPRTGWYFALQEKPVSSFRFALRSSWCSLHTSLNFSSSKKSTLWQRSSVSEHSKLQYQSALKHLLLTIFHIQPLPTSFWCLMEVRRKLFLKINHIIQSMISPLLAELISFNLPCWLNLQNHWSFFSLLSALSNISPHHSLNIIPKLETASCLKFYHHLLATCSDASLLTAKHLILLLSQIFPKIITCFGPMRHISL